MCWCAWGGGEQRLPGIFGCTVLIPSHASCLHRHQPPQECVVSIFPVGCLHFCPLATGASQRCPQVPRQAHAVPGDRSLRPVWPTHMAIEWNRPRLHPTRPCTSYTTKRTSTPSSAKIGFTSPARATGLSLRAMRGCGGRADVCECSTVTHHTQRSCQQGAVDPRTLAPTLWHPKPLVSALSTNTPLHFY